MLSIGYGDLVTMGYARFFAVVQAGLGLLLPSAYFVKAFDEMGSTIKKAKETEAIKKAKKIKWNEDGTWWIKIRLLG